jgi:hypothetical protein
VGGGVGVRGWGAQGPLLLPVPALQTRACRFAAAPTWNAVRMYWVRMKGRSCLESIWPRHSLNSTLNLAISSSDLPAARRSASAWEGVVGAREGGLRGRRAARCMPRRVGAAARLREPLRPQLPQRPARAPKRESPARRTLLRLPAPRCELPTLAQSYSISRNGTTWEASSVKRSLTDSSPFQLSRCVLRSTNTLRGSPLPYHLRRRGGRGGGAGLGERVGQARRQARARRRRPQGRPHGDAGPPVCSKPMPPPPRGAHRMRTAIAPGFLSRRPW